MKKLLILSLFSISSFSFSVEFINSKVELYELFNQSSILDVTSKPIKVISINNPNLNINLSSNQKIEIIKPNKVTDTEIIKEDIKQNNVENKTNDVKTITIITTEKKENITNVINKINESKVYKNVNFNLGSKNIIDKYGTLKQVVLDYKNGLINDILLVGHTDNIGNYKSNVALSVYRANSVRNKLVNLGIPKDIISITAFGEQNPIATNNTKQGRYLNRRVEIKTNVKNKY